jgi:hypothetical protein
MLCKNAYDLLSEEFLSHWTNTTCSHAHTEAGETWMMPAEARRRARSRISSSILLRPLLLSTVSVCPKSDRICPFEPRRSQGAAADGLATRACSVSATEPSGPLAGPARLGPDDRLNLLCATWSSAWGLGYAR